MPSRNTPWLLALLALTAVRLVVAAWTPLSPDEAYYWVWSRALAPGYLDHPPMVALWVWLGTALAGDTPLGVRLLAPVAAAAGSLLVARAAADLFPGQRAGVPAAALLNGTLLFGVGAIVVLPLFYGVMGFVMTWITVWLYNVLAGTLGGVEIEVQ